MRNRLPRGIARLAFLLGAGASLQGQRLALRNGDTVVFYGDSITAQRLFTRFVEEALLTRYPTLHVRFVNAELPGDASFGGSAQAMAERVARDVVPFHPAMIAVMVGINDRGAVSPSSTADTFRKSYTALLDALKNAAPNARITLILPPHGETTHATDFPGSAKTIDSLAANIVEMEAQRQIHEEPAALVVDLHQPFVNASQRAQLDFPQLAPLLVPDRMHPSPTAQWIMASVLLSAWNTNPVVSRLTISAAETSVIGAEQTQIAALKRTATGMRWNELDEALPLPLDPDDALTPVFLKVSDIERADQEPLRVIALPRGIYQLLIDQKPIGTFSTETLERGINLALMKTPMLDQARGIDLASQRRATLGQAPLTVSSATAKTPPADRPPGVAEDDLAEAIRNQVTPRSHIFELRLDSPR